MSRCFPGEHIRAALSIEHVHRISIHQRNANQHHRETPPHPPPGVRTLKRLTTPSTSRRGRGAVGSPIRCCGSVNGTITLKIILTISNKVKRMSTLWSSNAPSRCVPKRWRHLSTKRLENNLHSSLVHYTPNWKQCQHLARGEWIRKSGPTHRVGYCGRHKHCASLKAQIEWISQIL